MPQVNQARIFHKLCLMLFTHVSAYTALFLQLLVSLRLLQNFQIVYKIGYAIPIFSNTDAKFTEGRGLAQGTLTQCISQDGLAYAVEKQSPISGT